MQLSNFIAYTQDTLPVQPSQVSIATCGEPLRHEIAIGPAGVFI